MSKKPETCAHGYPCEPDKRTFFDKLRDWAQKRENLCYVEVCEGPVSYPKLTKPFRRWLYHRLYLIGYKFAGPSFQDEITTMLAEQIREEIDKEIINMLSGRHDEQQEENQTSRP